MAINKRDIDYSRYRHPMLKLGSSYYKIYAFVERNPQCTREDIRLGLAVGSNQATGRVSDLIRNGLLVEVGYKQSPKTGKKVATLIAVPPAKISNQPTAITKMVNLYQSEYGTYFVSDVPIPGSVKVAEKKVTFNLKNYSKLHTSAKSELTIDADYEILEESQSIP